MDTNEYDKIISDSKKMMLSSFPSIIEFQTMSYCNANCIVCPYKDMDIKGIRMSDNDLNNILEEIILNKNKIKRVIPYLNNEPSFDKRMINILRILKKNDIFTEISTNMSMWTYDELNTIVKEKLIDDLRISFFAHNKKLYNELMPGLDFEKNVEKIKYLFNINDSIDIELIVILLSTLNINDIKNGLNDLFNYPKIHFFGFLDRCGKVKISKNEKVKSSNNKVVGCSLNRPFERCCIYADGNVVLCSQDWGKEVILGNVFESSIEEIWNNERSLNIRKLVLGEIKCEEDFLCNSCKLAILESENKKVLNFKGDKYMTSDDKKRI